MSKCDLKFDDVINTNCNKDKLDLINLPKNQLKNLNWIWLFNEYTIFHGLKSPSDIFPPNGLGAMGAMGATTFQPPKMFGEMSNEKSSHFNSMCIGYIGYIGPTTDLSKTNYYY